MEALYQYRHTALNELIKRIQNLPKELEKPIKIYLFYPAQRIKHDAIIYAPINFGILRKGIFADIRGKFPILESIVGVQGLAAKYWYYAEKGRGPGKMPPHDAIRLWVRRKIHPHFEAVQVSPGIYRRRYKRGHERMQAERKIERLTWAIKRKIAREGTKGAFFFKRAYEQNERFIIQAFGKIAELIVNYIGD